MRNIHCIEIKGTVSLLKVLFTLMYYFIHKLEMCNNHVLSLTDTSRNIERQFPISLDVDEECISDEDNTTIHHDTDNVTHTII